MAVRQWVTTSGQVSFTDSSNWDAAPEAGDVLVVNTGDAEIEGDVHPTQFDGIYFGKNFNGTIGEADAELEVYTPILHLHNSGFSNIRISGNYGTGLTSDVIYPVIVSNYQNTTLDDSRKLATGAQYAKFYLYVLDGKFPAELNVLRTATGNPLLDKVVVSGNNESINFSSVRCTNAVIQGGIVTGLNVRVEARVTGGARWTPEGVDNSVFTGTTTPIWPVSLYQYGGSVIPGKDQSTTLGRVNMLGGVMDMSDNNGSYVFTPPSNAEDFVVYSGKVISGNTSFSTPLKMTFAGNCEYVGSIGHNITVT